MPALTTSRKPAPGPLPAALHTARRAVPGAAESELVLDLGPESVQVVLTQAGPYSRHVLAAVEERSPSASLAVVAEPGQLFWVWLITPVAAWDEDPGRTFRYAQGTVILPPLTRTGPPGAYWVRTPHSRLVDPGVLAGAVREAARGQSSPVHEVGRLTAEER
ncbi:hypothetical protein BX283_0131 [Streptomyces sp. TLI_146]|nr:hypothetical protein BX283_0131 [Streptomyces sp. TLI_146]